MTILRPACYAKFKDLIGKPFAFDIIAINPDTYLLHEDSVYDRFERGVEVHKITLPLNELEDLIFNIIAKTVGPAKATKLNKIADLFAFGVDSLQATRIRNTLQQSLDLDGKALGQNGAYKDRLLHEAKSDY